ncbi:MAG: CBS domain-containing protein [Deltaproteobacteria bacterium]|nr:CBS domain-containing protein [Deltaproteobacteria bacterium]
MRTVSSIMVRDVKCLAPTKTVADAARFLEEQKFRHLPIVDVERGSGKGGKTRQVLLGIISDRDILRALPSDSWAVASLEKREVTAEPLNRVMTPCPHVVNPETPISEVAETMVTRKIDCLPVVVGSDRELVGMVTSDDVTRLLLESWAAEKAGVAAALLTGRIHEVSPTDDLKTVIELMQARAIRHLLITDGQGHLLGIVSDRDIARTLPALSGAARRAHVSRDKRAQGLFRGNLFAFDEDDLQSRKVLKYPVERIMTRKVITSAPTTSIATIAALMLQHRINAIPIVDLSTHVLAGVVTKTDLLTLAARLLREGTTDKSHG